MLPKAKCMRADKDMLVNASTVYSPCGRYRYRMSLRWDEGLPLCAFVLPAASGARAIALGDHFDVDLDASSRFAVEFARERNFGGVEIVCAFARIVAEPSLVVSFSDPVGPANDEHIFAALQASMYVVAAWSGLARFKGRAGALLKLAEAAGVRLCCLGVSADGSPIPPIPRMDPRGELPTFVYPSLLTPEQMREQG